MSCTTPTRAEHARQRQQSDRRRFGNTDAVDVQRTGHAGFRDRGKSGPERREETRYREVIGSGRKLSASERELAEVVSAIEVDVVVGIDQRAGAGVQPDHGVVLEGGIRVKHVAAQGVEVQRAAYVVLERI